ncbi:uncharacterized protein PV06_09777 [Exophiala oligosperma]|uniref:PEBP-like protein n=2 Tax=Chaetothyriales TaxID=34395 RepID=A0A0D2D3B6_9EURO|nr:uncharacterized protein PV06_09777 [Exophiala oligosperma]KAJ9632865.1 hypothetical protein H2204_007595 [Knufia peltigerae]KIW37788.1 hypothetical protein PV06_09777 [Exophiala oligosperma]
MKSSYSPLAVLVLAATAGAQSAPGFPVQVNNELSVDFQSSSDSFLQPGQMLSLNDVQDAPTASGPSGSTRTLSFMLFMIDQDVKSDDGSRVELLHYFQPNLAGASEVLSDFSKDAQNFTSASPVQYIAPGPPAGDGPHRYTLLLYPQFEGFSVPKAYSSFFPPANVNARIGFDMAGFAKAANLPQPVGANWFEVQNGEAAPSSTAGSGSAASTRTSSSDSASTSASDSSATTTASGSTGSSETSATAATGSTLATSLPSSSATSSASASASASATPASSGGNAAGSVDARNSFAGLVVALSMSVFGLLL